MKLLLLLLATTCILFKSGRCSQPDQRSVLEETNDGEPLLLAGDEIIDFFGGDSAGLSANVSSVLEKYPFLPQLFSPDTLRFQQVVEAGGDIGAANYKSWSPYTQSLTTRGVPSSIRKKQQQKSGDDDEQLIFLDFTPQLPYYEIFVTNCISGLVKVPRRVFTFQEQEEIKKRLERDLGRFGVKFTTDRVSTHPFELEFSTVRFFIEASQFVDRTFFGYEFWIYTVDLDSCPDIEPDRSEYTFEEIKDRVRDFRAYYEFGEAENVDFLNTNKAELAIVQGTDFLDFIINVSGGVDIAEAGLGVPSEPGESIEDYFSRIAVNGASNIAAHQIGHLLGLRHHDSWGPLGNYSVEESYGRHIMTQPATILSAFYSDDAFFSERSALKLAASLQADIISEYELRDYNDKRTKKGKKLKELDEIKVPDTLLSGINSGGTGDFLIGALVFYGSILEVDDVGKFRFHLEAGKYINIEIISSVDNKFTDFLDPGVTLFLVEDDGSLKEIATNNDEEVLVYDSFIVDVLLEETGTYEVQVKGMGLVDKPILFERDQPDEYKTGDYAGFISMSSLLFERTGKKNTKKKGSKKQRHAFRQLEAMATPSAERRRVSPRSENVFTNHISWSQAQNVTELLEKYPRLPNLFSPDTARFQHVLQTGDLFAVTGGPYSFANSFATPKKLSGKKSSEGQLIFLDFNPQVPFYEIFVYTVVDELPCGISKVPRRLFSPDEQAEIKERLERDYAPFGFKFTTDRLSSHPFENEFTTLRFYFEQPFVVVQEISLFRRVFEVAVPGDTCPESIPENFLEYDPVVIQNSNPIITKAKNLGGFSENIDFLNTNKAELAVLDGADFVDFVINFMGQVDLFESVSGVPRHPGETVEEYTRRIVVNGAANIGAHELGHLFGLRHHDAIGPIGFTLGSPAAANDTETRNHVMSTPGMVPGVFASFYGDNVFFSERSALKLAASLGADCISEQELKEYNEERTKKGKTLKELDVIQVPNTLDFGLNAGDGDDFAMRALVFYGTILEIGDMGKFRFHLEADTAVNIEIISTNDNKFQDFVDAIIRLFLVEDDESLTPVTFFEVRDPENTRDPYLSDVVLNVTGSYEVQVTGFPWSQAGFTTELETGDYAGLISASTYPLEQVSASKGGGKKKGCKEKKGSKKGRKQLRGLSQLEPSM